MKSLLTAVFSLCLGCLCAQSPDTLFVNGIPFSDIEGPLMKVTVRKNFDKETRERTIKLQVDYGQVCGSDEKGEEVSEEECYTLNDQAGNFLPFPNEVSALNFLENNGWELTTEVTMTMITLYSVYTFRKDRARRKE